MPPFGPEERFAHASAVMVDTPKDSQGVLRIPRRADEFRSVSATDSRIRARDDPIRVARATAIRGNKSFSEFSDLVIGTIRI